MTRRYVFDPSCEQLSAWLGEIDCGRVGSLAVEDYEPVRPYACTWDDDWPDLEEARKCLK